MGACGDDRCVVKQEQLVAPKEMNYKWFEMLSRKLKENYFLDWDWYSFAKNILIPNQEHIKVALKISDKKVNRLLKDGHVFLNNFNGSFLTEEDLGDYVEGVDVGYCPNFKNFLEHDNLEY